MKYLTRRSVALALAGTAMSVGAVSTASAAVTTMYNLSYGASGSLTATAATANPVTGNTTDPWSYDGVTDGWANGATTALGTGTAAAQAWAGTASSTATPFGYTGAHMNWGFEITGGSGGTGTISTNDSKARYGIYADIDTAQGAWAALNTGTFTYGGWRHDTDVGLFKSDTSGLVTLTATNLITSPSGNFGFTIFKGMDSVTSYNHHGQWNGQNNTQGTAPDNFSNPWYLTSSGTAAVPTGTVSATAVAARAGTPLSSADIVAYSVGGASPSGLNTIQFYAQAGQVYEIFLGGYRNGAWGSTNDGYALTISQVPVPAAVWLLGSALAGMGIIGRRKQVV